MTPENIRAAGEFGFSLEADRILLAGICLGRSGQLKALQQVQQLMPSLGVEAIDARMQQIAADGIPRWLKADEFWTTEMDNVLLKGMQQGRVGAAGGTADETKRKRFRQGRRQHPFDRDPHGIYAVLR